jgi:BioD-like phosphotransacetylase family protein
MMKSLYITSVERYSGKTAVCLGLGTHFQAAGYRIGYMKPLSLQPYRLGDRIVDEDAAFVKIILGLAEEAWEISPVVVSPESLRRQLESGTAPEETDSLEKVKTAYQAVGQNVDLFLLEGGASLREGYSVGLPTPVVAEALDSTVLVVVKYRDEIRLVDDILAAQKRLGNRLGGCLINHVAPEAVDFVTRVAAPTLEKRGIPIYGALPEVSGLAAMTVGELVKLLEAEVLTRQARPQALVENLTVGAMTAEAALSRFRKQAHKAVITGGDRTDIQLAALETSTACLILTGNLRPSPLVIRQADEFGVTVMLVRPNTMETIETIDRVYGKTRLGEETKLKQFQALLAAHFDFKRLAEVLQLPQK